MLVYKILLPDEWAQFESTGRFDGSPLDMDSGYIHCSSREQVGATAMRVFPDEPALVVVALDAGALGEALRWEEAADGGTFPHVYAPLTRASIATVYHVPGAAEVGTAVAAE
ncbi:MAG TPA: DUF952 domain-containing protein [Acidimicrobiales bacterium]|nr:DUF952 domain-containing protein [Acidimicrobiales bacterium]